MEVAEKSEYLVKNKLILGNKHKHSSDKQYTSQVGLSANNGQQV